MMPVVNNVMLLFGFATSTSGIRFEPLYPRPHKQYSIGHRQDYRPVTRPYRTLNFCPSVSPAVTRTDRDKNREWWLQDYLPRERWLQDYLPREHWLQDYLPRERWLQDCLPREHWLWDYLPREESWLGSWRDRCRRWHQEECGTSECPYP